MIGNVAQVVYDRDEGRTAFRMLMQFAAAMMLMAFAAMVSAASPYIVEFGGVEKTSELRLSIGKSQMIYSKTPLDQVVIGSPDIADLKLLSSQQVLILGKKPGRTNLVFRDKQRSLIALMDVIVGYDLDGIKRKIYEALPGESMVEVRGSNDSVILSGQVSNLMAMDTALAIASTYVPKTNVINMMEVAGGQQVMLEVKIAEMNRDAGRELGIKTTYSSSSAGQTTGLGTDNIPRNAYSITGSIFDVVTAPAFLTGTIASASGRDIVSMTLNAMEAKGLAKTLAEPNIIALSGQEASFLAGGEIPVQVVSQGEVGYEYKEYGVGLKFTPTVLSNKKINIKLSSEVSDIDLQYDGTGTALSTRRASTVIEMADGQSFAIAGLMKSDMNNVVNQVPGLGDIPVLGALFRSSDYQRGETELVMIVTPRLVKPVKQGDLAEPTDGFIPPNWVDQYLLGRLEGVPPKEEPTVIEITKMPEESSDNTGGVQEAHGHNL